MRLSTLLPSALALGAAAQSSAPYTDAKTGITFQALAVSPNLNFGIALDSTPSADFIGQIVGKGTSGYSGFSLGGSMVNKLLIAAWPTTAGAIVSTFRETPKTQSPPEITGSFTMTPIANGTFVNSTHYTYTFLCKACILADGTTFAQTDNTTTLGWAYSTASPVTPSNHSSTLPKHASNGNFGLNLAGARSASFKTWSGMAGTATAYTVPEVRARSFEG